MNEKTLKRQMSSRWGLLVIGVILLLVLGLLYAWSVFRGPLMEELGQGVANTFTITMIMFCLGGLVGGIINSKASPRVTLILCLIFVVIGVFGTSLVHSAMGVFLTYGVCYGFGVGLGYNTTISTLMKWFPDKQGLASGILLMGFGFGAMILGMIASSMMAAMGWRSAFKALAIALGVIILIGAFVVRPASDEFVQQLTQGGGKTKPAVEEVNTMGMLARRNFWLFFLWAIILSAAGLIVINTSTPYAEQFVGAGAAAGIAGIVSIANGGGRVIFGGLFDKIGYRMTMLLNCAVCVVAGLVLLASLSTMSTPILVLAFILIGISYGGAPTSSSAFTAFFFGRKHYAVNFPIMNLNLIVASIIGPILANAFNYQVGFVAIIVFGVVGAVLTLLLKKPEPNNG